MMSAAVVSSLRALRMRPSGFSAVSVGSPLTSGMTTTPVSKPDSPRASAGKTSSDAPMIPNGAEWAEVIAAIQSWNAVGWSPISRMPRTSTTELSPR